MSERAREEINNLIDSIRDEIWNSFNRISAIAQEHQGFGDAQREINNEQAREITAWKFRFYSYLMLQENIIHDLHNNMDKPINEIVNILENTFNLVVDPRTDFQWYNPNVTGIVEEGDRKLANGDWMYYARSEPEYESDSSEEEE